MAWLFLLPSQALAQTPTPGVITRGRISADGLTWTPRNASGSGNPTIAASISTSRAAPTEARPGSGTIAAAAAARSQPQARQPAATWRRFPTPESRSRLILEY
jgi:hypothetical protein